MLTLTPETLSLLEEIESESAHYIPFYAYGDNEAACEMAGRLDRISVLVARALETTKS